HRAVRGLHGSPVRPQRVDVGGGAEIDRKALGTGLRRRRIDMGRGQPRVLGGGVKRRGRIHIGLDGGERPGTRQRHVGGLANAALRRCEGGRCGGRGRRGVRLIVVAGGEADRRDLRLGARGRRRSGRRDGRRRFGLLRGRRRVGGGAVRGRLIGGDRSRQVVDAVLEGGDALGQPITVGRQRANLLDKTLL